MALTKDLSSLLKKSSYFHTVANRDATLVPIHTPAQLATFDLTSTCLSLHQITGMVLFTLAELFVFCWVVGVQLGVQE